MLVCNYCRVSTTSGNVCEKCLAKMVGKGAEPDPPRMSDETLEAAIERATFYAAIMPGTDSALLVAEVRRLRDELARRDGMVCGTCLYRDPAELVTGQDTCAFTEKWCEGEHVWKATDCRTLGGGCRAWKSCAGGRHA